MPTLLLHEDFGDKHHLVVTEIEITQYVAPKHVKTSQLAEVVHDRGGELHIDYEGYEADEWYGDDQAARANALDILLAEAIEWFRARGTAIERDDLPHIFDDPEVSDRNTPD